MVGYFPYMEVPVRLTPHELRVVTKALSGDHCAFEILVKKFARLVYAQAYAIVQDSAEAEDIVQECFLRAFLYRVKLKTPAAIPNWHLAIARNLSRDRLRRLSHVAPAESPEEVEQQPELTLAPFRNLAIREEYEQLHVALAGLPNHYREALTLRYFHGMDYRAIGEQMNISNGALRGIMGRAVRALRDAMGPERFCP